MVAISIVVPATEAETVLPLLVSLDAQTLPADAFDIVVLDRGLSEVDRAIVDRAASRRPNAVVVDRTVAWSDQLVGEHVLLGASGRLYPAALEQLAAVSSAHDLAVVGSRTVRPGAGIDGDHLCDGPVEAASLAHVLDDDLLLVRRDLVRSGGDVPEVDAGVADRSTSAGASEVGVLGSYPTALLAPVATDDPHTQWSVRVTSADDRWSSGRLLADVTGQVVAPRGSTADLGAVRPVVLVRDGDSRLSVPVPHSLTVDATGALQGTIELDPRRVLLGSPLSVGVWHLDLVLAGPGVISRPTTLPATRRSVALLGTAEGTTSVVVVGATARRRWLLDVGPRKESVVVVGPEGATVTESHEGSVLELPLPDLHVATTSSVPGRIALGSLQLPARIDVTGDTAVLRAHVSGLSGREVVSAEFGGGPLRRTGLVLVVHGTGTMSLAAEPQESEPPTAPIGEFTGSEPAAEPAPARPSPGSRPTTSPNAPAPLTLRKIAGRAKRGLRRRVKAWRKARGH